MKFQCKKDELEKALNIVRFAVAKKTPMNVLQGILFRLEDQTLHLNASDLKIGIKTNLQVNGHSDGEIVLNAEMISSIVSKMQGPDIYFELKENNKVYLENLMSEFNLSGISPQEFPNFPEDNSTISFQIPAQSLKSMIDSTKFAMAREGQVPILMGAKLEKEEDDIHLIACDGFKLAIKNEGSQNDDQESIEVVLPSPTVNELSSVLSNFEDLVTVTLSPTQIFFSIGNTVLTSQLSEGQYIDYKAILPEDYSIEIKVNRTELLRKCELLSLVNDNLNNVIIKLDITKDKMTISTESERGDSTDYIEINNKGEDLLIGFNPKYLIDTLKAIHDTEIIMKFTTEIGPLEITPIEGSDFYYLVLPVRMAR